jgi:hypothetical protein
MRWLDTALVFLELPRAFDGDDQVLDAVLPLRLANAVQGQLEQLRQVLERFRFDHQWSVQMASFQRETAFSNNMPVERFFTALDRRAHRRPIRRRSKAAKNRCTPKETG